MTPEKQELIRLSFSKSDMLQYAKATLEAVDTGFVSIKVPKQPFMTRKAGMFNGAIIASLVDASSGYAAVSAKEQDCYVVTVELKVNYLNPAIGEGLLSKSYVIKDGRKIAVVRTEIYCLNEEQQELHVASSLVTMMYIKK